MNQFKTRSLRALSMFGALALSGAALAGDEDKRQQMDTNQDGVISAQEHTSGATAMFAKLDGDGDGRITAADMDAAHAAMGKDHAGGKSSAEMVQEMDTDGDGAVSAQEHAAAMQAKFAKLDTDGNGSISQAEHQAKKDMKDDR